MAKTISHIVKRLGKKTRDPEVKIVVAEDLSTVPGTLVREKDVSYYSKMYPLETQFVEKAADRKWEASVWSEDLSEVHRKHNDRNRDLVDAAEISGDIEPTGTPESGRDVTEEIRTLAREQGAGEVGFTNLDRRYVYASKQSWVKYPNAVCLALEQDYEQTQKISSIEAEHAHFGTYEKIGVLGLKVVDTIRTLGYHAQMHSPSDESMVFIPMFIKAGRGQLGANGQLLSPHFGSRCRLAIITTDAPVTYDKPVDYGIHKFCQKCQVCIRRCPARALVKEKVWWRGVQKNKVSYNRCRPVMEKYAGCGVCMKVCPIQRYGKKSVMDYYVATGQVLGKGTDDLEGFTFNREYFRVNELPQLGDETFQFPHGSEDEWLFKQFKERLKKNGLPSADQLQKFASDVKRILDKGSSTRYDHVQSTNDPE